VEKGSLSHGVKAAPAARHNSDLLLETPAYEQRPKRQFLMQRHPWFGSSFSFSLVVSVGQQFEVQSLFGAELLL
jgi:hypothetical protein